MKTFTLMDGTEFDAGNIVSIGAIHESCSIGASIPAWGSSSYSISLKNGKTLSSSKSWTVGFWNNIPKNPVEKERMMKELESERSELLELWKTESE